MWSTISGLRRAVGVALEATVRGDESQCLHLVTRENDW